MTKNLWKSAPRKRERAESTRTRIGRHAQIMIETLESRTLLATSVLTIIPEYSPIDLNATASFFGTLLQSRPQAPGSLTSQLSGSLTIDRVANTLAIVAPSQASVVDVAGSFRPVEPAPVDFASISDVAISGVGFTYVTATNVDGLLSMNATPLHGDSFDANLLRIELPNTLYHIENGLGSFPNNVFDAGVQFNNVSSGRLITTADNTLLIIPFVVLNRATAFGVVPFTFTLAGNIIAAADPSRVSANSSVFGSVFTDLNQDGIPEPAVGERVYIDRNFNNVFDASEPSALIDSSGDYSFDHMPPGGYLLRTTADTRFTGNSEHSFFLDGTEAMRTDFGNRNAAVSTWTGAGDNTSWDDPANWASGIVPNAIQSVTVSASTGDGEIVLRSPAPRAIGGGTIERPFRIEGDVAIEGNLNLFSQFSMSSGSSLRINPLSSLYCDGEVSIDGVNVTVESNGSLNLPGLASASNMDLRSAGGVSLTNLLTLRNSRVELAQGGMQLRATEIDGTRFITHAGSQFQFNGDIQNQDRTIAIEGVGSARFTGRIRGGRLTTPDGASIQLTNTLLYGVTLESMRVVTSSAQVADGLTLDGDLTIDGGFMSFAGDMAVDGVGSIILVNNATLGFLVENKLVTFGSNVTIRGSGKIERQATLNPASVQILGPIIVDSGVLALGEGLRWRHAGTISVAAGGTLELTGTGLFEDPNVAGKLRLDSAIALNGTLRIPISAEISGSASISLDGGRLEGSTLAFDDDVTIIGHGVLGDTTGPIDQIVVNRGTIIANGSGDGNLTLRGSPFRNEGRVHVASGATLLVSTRLDLGASSVLELEAEDVDDSVRIGRVQIAGQASFAGTFQFLATSAVAAKISESERFLSAGAVSGAFDTEIVPANVTLFYGPTDLGLLQTGMDVTDLAVTSVTINHQQIRLGREIELRYRVVNRSPNALVDKQWFDLIYISSDDRLGPDDRILRRLSQSRRLDANEAYEEVMTLTPDALPEGEYHLIVVTDAYGQVDSTGLGNRDASPAFDIVVPLLHPNNPFGDQVSATFDHPGDVEYYKFEWHPSSPYASLYLSLGSSVTEGSTEIYIAREAIPTPNSYSYARRVGEFSPPNRPNKVVYIPILSEGTYYVRLSALSGPAANALYTLFASEDQPLLITDVSPDRGSNLSTLTVSVTGSSLNEVVTAALIKEGSDPIVATTIVDHGTGRLNATFNLRGRATGLYSLKVTDQGGRTSTYGGGIEVVSEPGQLVTTVDIPSVVRRNRTAEIFISYQNVGLGDVFVPVYRITVENAELYLPGSNVLFYSRDSVVVYGDSPALRPHLLPAGASGQIIVPFAVRQGVGRINVERYEDGPFPWERVREETRPAGVTVELWSELVERARARLGYSMQEVLLSLAEINSTDPLPANGILALREFDEDIFGSASRLMADALRTTTQQIMALGPETSVFGELIVGEILGSLGDQAVAGPDLPDPRYAPPTPVSTPGFYIADRQSPDVRHRTVPVGPGGEISFDVDGNYLPTQRKQFGVYLRPVGEIESSPDAVYIITHGWKGTVPLHSTQDVAQWIKFAERDRGRDVDVYLLDWTEGAVGLLSSGPSRNIAPAAEAGWQMILDALNDAGVDPSNLTLIGESYGTYLNNQVAERLFDATGIRVRKQIAFNPANPVGGYEGDIQIQGAQFNLVFHARTIADTQEAIGDLDFVFEGASSPGLDWDRAINYHLYGMRWLRHRLAGDSNNNDRFFWLDASWNNFDLSLFRSDLDGFVNDDGLIVADPSVNGSTSLLLPRQPSFFPEQRIYSEDGFLNTDDDVYTLFGYVEYTAETQSVGSSDPNEKTGPRGVGPEGFVANVGIMPYTVNYENLPAATAPALDVIVTDQLDTDLDWTTFQLGDIGFGLVVIDVPEGLRQFHANVLTQNLDGTPLRVDVVAGIDLETGLVRWEFHSIDPDTGLPPNDPLAGFLPPDDETGRGEGFVRYYVRPKAGSTTGTVIQNNASIVFDVNDPIITNTVINTIDLDRPTSRVLPLPELSPTTIFEVSWEGTDGSLGSGIASYDVFVATDNGPYELWLRQTTLTSMQFVGLSNHTYSFVSAAVDHVGQREELSPSPDATIRVAPLLEVTSDKDFHVVPYEPALFEFHIQGAVPIADDLYPVGVDWQADGTIDALWMIRSGQAFEYSFAEIGQQAIRFVLLANGSTPTSLAETSILMDVTAPFVRTDAQGRQSLVIGGSPAADHIIVDDTGTLLRVDWTRDDSGDRQVTDFAPFAGPVHIFSGDGNDRIDLEGIGTRKASVWSGQGNDTVMTGAGDDDVEADGAEGLGNDVVSTGGGNDEIIADGSEGYQHEPFLGQDTIEAGAGDDLIRGDGAEGERIDYIDAGDGDDVIYADGAEAIPSSSPSGQETIIAGSGDDVVVSDGPTGNEDLIYGNDGDDLILAGADNDIVFAGDGADVIIAGPDGDFVTGDNGSDLIVAGNIQLLDLESLRLIQAEWRSPRPLIERIAHIEGTGDGPRENQDVFLDTDAMILDDLAVDFVLGGWGADWLIIQKPLDGISDFDPLEDIATVTFWPPIVTVTGK